MKNLDSNQTKLPFNYYYLNFCKPEHIKEAIKNIGRILTGEVIENTPYKLSLNDNKTCEALCGRNLDDKDIENFKWMIDNEYKSNWVLDSLPAGYRISVSSENTNYNSFKSGIPIGFKAGSEYYIFNHLQFIVKVYEEKGEKESGWRIVGFLIQPLSFFTNAKEVCEDLALIDLLQSFEKYTEKNLDNSEIIGIYYTKGLEIEAQPLTNNIRFSYSVSFIPSKIPWTSRWDTYLYKEKGEVHWLSIINSFGMVIFLSIMVFHLFRRNVSCEITIYNETIDEDPEIDSGWKQLRGDVFRPPTHVNLFCAGIGTGIQIILMAIFTITFASIGLLRPEHRGALLSIMLFLFAFMGIFAGYVAGRFYKTLGGEHWKINSLTVSLMFPGLCFSIFFCINFLIWEEESSGAVDFVSLIELLGIWFTISLPLTLIGAGLGYKKSPMKNPCRISRIPKPIPLRNNTIVYFVCLLAGSLPFGCMFIELNYIMNSIWHISLFYYLFGFLFLCFIVLSLTSAEVSILMTYIVLCREDYRWWWLSFAVPGSSGIYMFVYSMFYYFISLELTRFSSTILYFGYMLLVSVAYGFITGTIGFLSTYLFIKKIYSMIKSE